MDIVKQVEGICFEWDSNKALLVIREHDVSFEEALTVLIYDDNSFTNEDIRDYDGEERYITIGMSTNVRLLCVTWTLREDNYRLITVRKANKHEEKGYYHG